MCINSMFVKGDELAALGLEVSYVPLMYRSHTMTVVVASLYFVKLEASI